MTSPDTASAETTFGAEAETVDYVVVGSGAGGGPLAANLALAGYTVALLEAGGDESPPEYQVPAFYTRSVEHADLSWKYFVRHYADRQRQRLDSKYCEAEDGVFYPRSGTLGGCTAHHAMITVYTHAYDWDHIAALLGDDRWSAPAMEKYFRRLENCRYIPPLTRRRTRHGFHGWLPTDIADPLLALKDWKIVRIALAAFCGAVQGRFWESFGKLLRAYWRAPSGPIRFLKGYFDPNDRPHSAGSEEGLYLVPVSVDRGRRAGARERILQAAASCPDRLLIRTHALATRVLFEGKRAVGVEYLSGKHLYAADPNFSRDAPDRGERRRIRARREVILAAGSFNSPQLLKLSGVGPRAELERLGIEVVADLPGVGENLQDRYEISVITKLKSDFAITRGATFRAPGPGEPPDPLYAQWLEGKGPYTTNGGILAQVKQSRRAVGGTDLIAFAVPGLFRGYFPGFSTTIAQERNYYSWVILKAHVRNMAGYVRLRSRDPTERPEINFRYFDEGSGDWRADLDAVTEAVQYFRSVSARTRSINLGETLPGPDVRSETEVQDYVMRECWGHHASCTNKMALASDPMAVVDGAFRVHGLEGLRVVDASVFPFIPGFFIVTAVYMISEKASDLIIADAKASDLIVAESKTTAEAEAGDLIIADAERTGRAAITGDLRQALDAQSEFDEILDEMQSSARARFIALYSRDRFIYWIGFAAYVFYTIAHFDELFTGLKTALHNFVVSEAAAQDGAIGFLNQNYLPTLIFLCFVISFGGAVFGRTPTTRKAGETFAKIFAGALVGFVGGSAKAK